MKIDAGRLKNFKLKVIQKKTLRPTKSRIRNSIFDILDSRISFLDCNFFDLFSGTGAVGIEALNRGFKKSYFFETDSDIFAVLKKNLSRLTEKFYFELYFGDNRHTYQKLIPEKQRQPKVVFIDAPFALDIESYWVDLLQKEKTENCFLVVEKDKDLSNLFSHKSITPICLKKYGKIYLHLFQI